MKNEESSNRYKIRNIVFNNPKRILFFILHSSFFILLFGCRASVSFTGASIPPSAKTFSVQYFQNQAPLAGPTVSQTFTDDLRNYIASNSHLILVPDGDLDFKGVISGYTTAPATAAGASSGVSATTRLTMTVDVTYTDKSDPKKSFTTTFSKYADFPSSQSLSAVQGTLLTQIDTQLIQDIFDKAFNNW